MAEINDIQTTVVRTDRGLSVAGTRITLYQIMDYVKADRPPSVIRDHYQIMDYVKADRPPSVIRDHFRLTVKQTSDILKYIETHREEVETEYKQVLAYAEESRQYWEERNREHFAKIKAVPPEPGREHLYAKLYAAKVRLGMV